jgi:hypothetical protein
LRIRKSLESRALFADSRQTDICANLSAILLGGLLLNALFGWWWAGSQLVFQINTRDSFAISVCLALDAAQPRPCLFRFAGGSGPARKCRRPYYEDWEPSKVPVRMSRQEFLDATNRKSLRIV